MQTNTLGETKRSVSDVGLGHWQLGADWGDVSEADALNVLRETSTEIRVARERSRTLAPFRIESGPSSGRSVSAKGGA